MVVPHISLHSLTNAENEVGQITSTVVQVIGRAPPGF